MCKEKMKLRVVFAVLLASLVGGSIAQSPSCTNYDLRLVGGNSLLEGRVEICVSGIWGTVCDDIWDNTDAAVVCRQLGYSIINAVSFQRAFFGRGSSSQPIYLDNVACTGTERKLIDCGHNPVSVHNCGHWEDASVRCSSETVNCSDGDVRLRGGTHSNEGRIEVCYNEVWGTVCNDFWSRADARVVCRQLGYGENVLAGAIAYTDGRFGAGSGPIYLDNVACTGTETGLVNCSHDTHTSDCSHSEDAGVLCPICSNGDLRLSNGADQYEGRVEFCWNSQWGTVCDDLWDTSDATVVCRQLGLSTVNARAFSRAFFGEGSGPIQLDNVQCVGTESRLENCPHPTVGDHNCNHWEDAGVRCQKPCTNNDIRLVGGRNESEGRVEVCVNGQWGTVCDDLWGTTDANVVCRQLGYSRFDAIAVQSATFGRGSGAILLDDVACTGSESRLVDCPYDRSTGDCSHFEDAGVRCNTIIPCEDGEIRLRGGSVPHEGRVEVCFGEVWGTVCDDLWSAVDANVACRQVGFSRFNATAYSTARFGQGTGPIYLDNTACSGTESRLIDCSYSSHTADCSHFEDAGVHCQPILRCKNGDVRLLNSSGLPSHEGRVEICFNETWGTVCSNVWSDTNANVVCRELGHSRFNAVSYTNAHFGQGTGSIYLDNVICTGTEERLISCSYDRETSDCSHTQDVGIHCNTPPICEYGEIRLVGDQSGLEGRVEICVDETWGTVCDDFWQDVDARVVCKELGFSRYSANAFSSARFGRGSGPILLDDVSCTGLESRLINCTYDSHTADCSHFEDASVQCFQKACIDGDIRLVGGSTVREGRVEVCQNEVWGTVCDDSWTTPDASVACKQLGHSRFGAVSTRNAQFGQGTGPIYLDNVACSGSELRLIDCNYDPHTLDCGHNEDAGVVCLPIRCRDGDVRLRGGSVLHEGRVEVCFDEVWGTVCDDSWSGADANVVCRQLGYSRHNATAYSGAHFGQGTGSIYLDNVICTGTEERLTNCSYNRDTADCSHAQDIGVHCEPLVTCVNGEIQLDGGQSDMEGRVEICVDEIWGTVCDDSWQDVDANIACRQLGFSRYNATAYSGARFGQGSGPILLDDVQCTGSEYSLVDCPYDGHTGDCSHSKDASVECEPLSCNNGDLRLVGGQTTMEGRVEICWNETWGTVCDGFWGSNDARVACKQLGFSKLSANVFRNAYFGQGTGPILLDDLLCSGSEDKLVDCRHDGIGQYDFCTHADDAGVRCYPRPCLNGDIRLVGGLSEYEGRVEFCWEEVWGTVCDDLWDANDAQVVCRDLGYNSSSNNILAVRSAAFGQGSGSIFLDDVLCEGTEEKLINCSHRGIGSNNCGHYEDAGVRCGQCTEKSIRLVGGSTEYEGRVEVCLSGRWGTVCDDNWGNTDATVVCGQLGLPETNAVGLSGAPFGEGTLPIVMDEVRCSGQESKLADCPYNGADSVGACSHTEDAGVRCQAPVPGAPQRVAVIALSSTQLSVSWSPPLPSQRYGTILRYNATCSRTGYLQEQATQNNSTRSVVMEALLPYTSYSCCVTAINAVGEGTMACTNGLTSEIPPTASPNNLQGYATSSFSLFLSWNPPPIPHRNGLIRQYHINVTETDTGRLFQLSSSTLQKDIVSLHPYYTYECIVAAFTVGLGPSSQSVTIQTFGATPSGSPQNFAAVSNTGSSISTSWDPPALEHRNGIITGYTVRLTYSGGSGQHSTGATTRNLVIQSLNPYTLYICSVAAKTVNGTGPFSITVTVQTEEVPPTAAPQSLTAVPVDSRTLTLSWNPPPSDQQNGIIREYRIRITHISITTSTLNTQQYVSTSTQLVVTLLHPYYTYLCSVAAYTVGVGPYSGVVSVQMPQDVPGPPQNFATTLVTATSVTLLWDPPLPDEQNGIITKYTVRVTQAESGIYEEIATTTHHLVDSLEANQLYSFVVAAHTVAGKGTFSNTITVSTGIVWPSAPPNDFSVAVLSPTALQLSWSPPPPEFQNGMIQGYTISVTEDSTSREWEYNSTATLLTVSSLHPYYQYHCKVAAFTTIGLGPFTQLVSRRTQPDVPIGYPTGVSAMATSSHSITLNWSPPPPPEQNGPIIGYTINVTVLESDETFQRETDTTSLTVDARPYRTYSFFISAKTVVGNGPFGRDVIVRTPESAPSHVPRNISEEILGPYSFRLTWQPPPDEHHNGVIRAYTVNITEVDTGRKFRHTTVTNVTEIVVEDLHPFYLYNCTVSAVTTEEGPHSAVIAVITEEAAPTGTPGSLHVIPLSSTSIHLTWNPPTAEHRNGIIRKYEIIVADLQIFSLTNSQTVSNLRPYTTYNCRVAAYSVAIGPFSQEVEVLTMQDRPSGPPQGVTATPSDSRTLVLTWQPPTEEDRNGIITQYTVTVTEVLTGVVQSQTTGNTQLRVEALHPYYSYHCNVAAATVIGYGPPSQDVPVEIPEDVPESPPLNAMARVLSSTMVNITWQPPLPQDHNGIIRQYQIDLYEVNNTGRQFPLISAPEQYILLDFLHPFFTYRYKIAAVTVGPGPYTLVQNFTTEPGKPGIPQEFSATEVDSRTIELTWQPPLSNELNGVIRQYVVNVTDLATREEHFFTTMETSMRVEMLHPFYSYLCSVAAETSVGQGPYITTVVHLSEDIPTRPPQDILGEPIGPRTLRLSWNPPPLEHRNGAITEYKINITEVETETELPQLTSVATTLTVRNLHPSYHYQCSIAAVTIGAGPYSDIIPVQTEIDVPSRAPQNFSLELLSPGSILLTWEPPPKEYQNGNISGYVLRITAVERGETYQVSVESTSLRNNTLRAFSTYNFSVAATTKVGTGPFTEVIIVNTPTNVPAVAPRAGDTKRISATSIRVSWVPLTLEESRGIVTSYHVKYRPVDERVRRNLDDTSTVINTTKLDVVIEGLDPRLAYAVAFAASTVAGIGNYSKETVIGVFHNSLFQLHLSGAIICEEWLSEGYLDKTISITEDTSQQLESVCDCIFSAKYIGDSALICANSTNKMVFQGRMISTDAMNSTALMEYLAEWAQTAPTVVAKGVQLMVSPHCSVFLHELGNTTCIPLEEPDIASPSPTPSSMPPSPSPSPTPTPTGDTAVTKPEEERKQTESSSVSLPIPMIAGGAFGVLLVVAVVIIVIIAIVTCKRRRSKSKSMQIRTRRDLRLNLVTEPGLPTSMPAAKNPLSHSLNETTFPYYEDDDHIYDSIPDLKLERSPNYENCKVSNEDLHPYNKTMRGGATPQGATGQGKDEDYSNLDTNGAPRLQYRYINVGPHATIPNPYELEPQGKSPYDVPRIPSLQPGGAGPTKLQQDDEYVEMY